MVWHGKKGWPESNVRLAFPDCRLLLQAFPRGGLLDQLLLLFRNLLRDLRVFFKQSLKPGLEFQAPPLVILYYLINPITGRHQRILRRYVRLFPPRLEAFRLRLLLRR